MKTGYFGVALAALFTAVAVQVQAQWKTQQIPLSPGWNAIHLQVEPTPSDIESVFQNVPVESVWYWNGRFRSVQFLTDPEELLVDDPNWLVWFPATSPQAAANNLHALRGGSRYLVKLAGTQQVNLTMTGTPNRRGVGWLTDAYTLAGFQTDPAAPPTFGDFFASSKAHQDADAFWRLDPQGFWEAARQSDAMQSGKAFWARTNGATNFQGPLTISSLTGGALDFGRLADTLSFTITNNTSRPRTISLVSISSAAPPDASEASVAGQVPLSYEELLENDPTRTSQLVPISAAPRQVTLDPSESRELTFAIRRNELATIPPGTNSFYQSLLRITDGEGSLFEIPVRALAPNQNDGDFARGRLVARRGTRASSASPYCGLWVGTVTLDSVSLPANLAAPQRLEPAAGEFPFRILLHVDENGEVRLIKQVTVMAKTENSQTRIVLVTDDDLLDDFEGLFVRDGELVGQRISSVNFPFFSEQNSPGNTLPKLPGTIFEDGDGQTTDTLMFHVAMDYDNPVNPFMHQFHPDHDNLNALFEPFDEGTVDITGDSQPDLTFADSNFEESFAILREMELKFSGADPSNPAETGPAWLSTRVGGLYTERIYGLYRTDFGRKDGAMPKPIMTPIVVGGRFELVQVSTIGVLNDGI